MNIYEYIHTNRFLKQLNLIYKRYLPFLAPVATISPTAASRSWCITCELYILSQTVESCQSWQCHSMCVYVCERHWGSLAEGAACVCCGSLSVVSQLADRPGPQGAAHQRSPIHQPDRPSCWKAGRMDEGSEAGLAWLGLPVKQKLNVIIQLQPPSDVGVFLLTALESSSALK